MIYSRIDFSLISVAFQVQRHFDAAAKDKSKGGLDEKDETRGVIGDIIHYFTLMSSKLTLFALFFIFRHYSLFFQNYQNNVINSL